MANHRRIVVIAIGLACFFANCIYPHQEHPEFNRTINLVDGVIQGIEDVAYFAAGWPWSYYEHLDRGTLPSLNRWNLTALIGNIVFWALVFAIAWWNSVSHQRDSKGAKTGKRWRLSLANLFVMMLVVAGAFSYFAINRGLYADSQKLVRAIRSLRGATSEAYYWPKFLYDDYFVNYLLPRERVVGVSIEDPPDFLLRQIVSLPYLQSLCLSGSSYSLAELRPLLRNPHIQYLRISGRDIDRATLEMIGQSESLQALSFTETSINDAQLLHLGDMPSLRHLNLDHTKIELKETAVQPWMKAVRYLRLPSPLFGETPTFQLDGWPELLDVRLMKRDERQLPTKVIGLSVSNCPKLKRISVIEAQRFDLRLLGLPSVEEIIMRSEDGSGTQPRTLPVRRLLFKDLPSLAAVDLEIWDLDQIRIENCPQLHCTAYWTPETVSGTATVASGHRGVFSVVKAASSIDAEALIRSLSQCIGITSLDLAWLPTKDLDLSPIAACNTIKKLNLPAGISTAQLQQLSSLRGIEEIQFATSSDLQTMIDVWPNLRRIEGGSRFVGAVSLPGKLKQAAMRINLPTTYDPFVPIETHLHSAKNLESVLFGDFRGATSVRLTDLPQLNDVVQVSKNLQSLRVDGVPKLKGLLTFSPWVANASIDSISELQVFSAGGPRFNDEAFSGIEKSTTLRSLTLGHCAMTPEKLGAIGQFVNLTALGLTGSRVTDTTIREWSGLNSLITLMLDRTQVTPQSLPWICSQRSLKHLSIDSHCFASITPEQLDSLNQLSSLWFYGDGIPMDRCKKISSWKGLQTIRIENSKLTSQMLTQLLDAIPKTVQVLDLCFCQIAEEDFEEFVACLPNGICLGVEGLEVNEELQVELLRGYRAVIENDEDLFFPNGSDYSVRSSSWPTKKTGRPSGINFIGSSFVMKNVSNKTFLETGGLVKPRLFLPTPK